MYLRPMQIMLWLAGLGFATGIPLLPHAVAAQEPAAQATSDPAPGAAKPQSPSTSGEAVAREQRLVRYLTGAKFTGQFSVDGKGFGNLKDETYTIAKCEKLPEPDAYRLTAKIKYGETDGEFPMDLKIVFAGNTPVITLDNVWIPGLGTFSSRVLVHQGRYSGTWDHDAVGGHLFGKIEPASDKALEQSDLDK